MQSLKEMRVGAPKLEQATISSLSSRLEMYVSGATGNISYAHSVNGVDDWILETDDLTRPLKCGRLYAC